MELITIIIPVYNGENYIKKCIDSILKQTYSNFLLIVVDDGSKDHTREIIKDYEDNRIKFIHTKHFGVSNARNIGIDQSQGKYITFVDADDEVAEDFLESLINNFGKSVDLAMCSYSKIYKHYTKNKNTIFINQKEAYKYILNNKISGYVWNKLFLRDTIIKNKIYFSTKLSMGEDMLFISEYLKYCKNIKVDFNKKYYYRKNENQVTNKYDGNTTSVLFSWVALEKIYEKKCPEKLIEIKYRYLKKKYEFEKIIQDFNPPKMKIDYEKFSFYQKIKLKLHKRFAKIIVKSKIKK